MKFALVEGERREAKHGLSGKCPLYGQAMIAKCGEHRVNHWAHRANCPCDQNWKEPKTNWHRDWKDQFPREWQEIIQRSEAGEKHIADVKTESGVVLEFQHSPLPRTEREAREMFYRNMVWVVNGLRRGRDRKRFFASLTPASIVKDKPLTYSVRSNEGELLRDWGDSRKPVFFDFGDNNVFDLLRFGMPLQWRLHPHSPDGEAHLSPVTKTSFRDRCLKRSPLKGIDYSSEVRPRSLELIDLEDAWLSGRA